MEMKKSLVIGDTHFKVTNLDTAEKLFILINEFISSALITDLIFLGDIYDTKAIIRSEVQNFLIDKLSELTNKFQKLNIHILVGNHDFENFQCKNSALSPLKLISRVNVYDKEVVIDRGLKCAFIPFRLTNDEFIDNVSAIGRLNDPNIKTIFCHQGLSGFDLGSGMIDIHGVDTSLLSNRFSYIIGHYHAPQDKGNFCYLGTPFSHSFGESNQDKRVYVHSVNSDSGVMYSTKSQLPQHYKLGFSAKDNSWFESSLPFLEGIKDGDFVEVTVSCESDKVKEYDQLKISSMFSSSINLRIKYDIIDTSKTIRLQEGISFEQMLKKYLDGKGKSNLFEDGLKFLKDAVL